MVEVLEDYQKAFESDSLEGLTVFYSTHSTRELSRRYGDMLYKIQDMEVRHRCGVWPCTTYMTCCIVVYKMQDMEVRHRCGVWPCMKK